MNGINAVLYSIRDCFTSQKSVAMVNWREVDDDIPPHMHEFFEIALVEGGTGGHLTANGVQQLSRGNMIIIRPGGWHGFVQCCHLSVHNCCFDQCVLTRELAWLREDFLMNYLLWTGPYMDDHRGILTLHVLEDCLDGCLKNWKALDQAQYLPRRGETIGYLLILLETLLKSVEELDHLKQQTRPIHPAVVESIRLLESQIEYAWSIGDLASKVHLNPSYLVRLFKTEIGLSPIAYLNHYRLERSAGLLQTAMPASEIAALVGWFDPNLFSRRFRAAYGMSPSEYRKRFGSYKSLP